MQPVTRQSNSSPLFMHFVQGKKHEDEGNLQFVYDPIKQIAFYYMGGGNSNGPRETKKGGRITDRVVHRRSDGSPDGVRRSMDDDARYVQDK